MKHKSSVSYLDTSFAKEDPKSANLGVELRRNNQY